ncbi:hypothetical protein CHUAL_001591 [Chamberlinius hualienensis]
MSTNRIKRPSTSDLMDDWLDSQGYYRKHIPDDSSCLFRAVSEQLFNTQIYHTDIRTKCADYMDTNKDKFSALIDDSFDNYITILRNPKEWGGHIELMAMSSLLKCDFSVFQDVGKSMYKVTNNGYSKIVMLCQTSGNHYDSVYTKTSIQTAAFTQSIIYEVLYKKVFDMGDEVDFAVETMLHDKVYAKARKDSTASMDSNHSLPLDFGSATEESSKEGGSEIRQSLARGFPPFPYKVAKALDPNIYRNVEFDVWNESKKGEIVYEPGVKCLVRLDKNKPETYHAHIQEMIPDLGPVTLYIVELGKKETVPYDCLEPLPPAKGSNGSCYQKQVGGTSPDFEVYKGKKKLFRKSKYKDLQFSVTVPRGQPIPPRFQHPNKTPYTPNTNQLGRERDLQYQGNVKNVSAGFKWITNVNTNNRYRPRNPEGTNYTTSEFSYNEDNGKTSTMVQNIEKAGSQPPNVLSQSVNWPKPSKSMPDSSSVLGSTDNERCTVPLTGTSQSSTKTTSNISVESATSNAKDAHNDISCDNSNDGSTTPPPPLISQQYLNQETSAVSSPLLASPQPVTVLPYQYLGVCLPYEPPLHSINYATQRSRDPHGNDLPLHDLITLRFFYNLGHDYFRSATIITMPTNQYHSAVWSYGSPVTYPTVSGYGTPTSTLGTESDVITESPATSAMTVSSSEGSSQEVALDGSVPKDFYEPTYFYDSPHINLLPTTFQPSMAIDYSSLPPPPPPVHSGVNESLVLNEQGVLSLSNQTQNLALSNCTSNSQAINNQRRNNPPVYNSGQSTRFRTDSGSSSRSQRNNWQPNLMNSKFSRLNTNSNEAGFSPTKVEHSLSASNQWSSPRYQQRTAKPISGHYNSGQPPPPQHHHVPQPTTYPIIHTGNPIMAASSPTSIGLYTGSPTTFYGSPPTTALLFPQTHVPQPISYMATQPQ